MVLVPFTFRGRGISTLSPIQENRSHSIEKINRDVLQRAGYILTGVCIGNFNIEGDLFGK